MKTIGFPISMKENEHRRALLPIDIKRVANPKFLFFEVGYGNVLDIEDREYLDLGCNVVDRDVVLSKDIICDPKIGDAEYLSVLNNQTIFGWVHAVRNRDITDRIIHGKLTSYAWEDMFDLNRHVFWRNNELAGEAAIMHAFQCYGSMPYNSKVALIGRGNIARGALKILTLLGADVTIYTRTTETLLRKEFSQFNVIVNAVLWDTNRKDHLIYRDDLAVMKKGSLIIDISCDSNGGIETSVPTTIDNPMYVVDGIYHYSVDHTPSLFYRTVTSEISREVCKYINLLVEGKSNCILESACNIENGKVKDIRIKEFQGRV